MDQPYFTPGARHHAAGPSAREQHVIALFEGGMSKDDLRRAMPKSTSLIRRSLGFIGDNSPQRADAIRRASEQLRASVDRALNCASRHTSRPSAASCLAPLPRRLPENDQRPIAAGREPCPKCAVRGDIGCAHQRPDPALAPAPSGAPAVNLRGERRG